LHLRYKKECPIRDLTKKHFMICLRKEDMCCAPNVTLILTIEIVLNKIQNKKAETIQAIVVDR
jgi:hypothetical protein